MWSNTSASSICKLIHCTTSTRAHIELLLPKPLASSDWDDQDSVMTPEWHCTSHCRNVAVWKISPALGEKKEDFEAVLTWYVLRFTIHWYTVINAGWSRFDSKTETPLRSASGDNVVMDWTTAIWAQSFPSQLGMPFPGVSARAICGTHSADFLTCPGAGHGYGIHNCKMRSCFIRWSNVARMNTTRSLSSFFSTACSLTAKVFFNSDHDSQSDAEGTFRQHCEINKARLELMPYMHGDKSLDRL